MNSYAFSGRLTRDIETKTVGKNDTKVANFCVAVNTSYKDAEGKYGVAFIEVEAFGNVCNVLEEYFKKGDPIEVVGEAKQDNWVDKSTEQKRSRLKFVLKSFSFPQGGAKPKPKKEDAESVPASEGEEIPF